jgi:hypothetical protein
MRDSDASAPGAVDDVDSGIELMRKCLDETRAQTAPAVVVVSIGFPIPLSETTSFQSDPLTSKLTITWQSSLSPGNACFRELITSSATTSPMLTAVADRTAPPPTKAWSVMGRVSPIKESARLSHSFER